MEKRTHSVSKVLRMTPEEAKLLSQKAKAAELSETAYLRLLLTQKPNDYPEIRILLKDLINEINHIGININQIVKDYNSALYYKDDKERLFAYMKKISKSIDEAVVKIGYQ